MRAVAIQEFGGPEGLALVDLPDPAPGPGEVLVETEAIGVGGVDLMILGGTLGDYGFRTGHVLGGEIAGTVTAVGAGAEAAWSGRRVWGFTGLGGGYAERAVAPAASLVALPDGLPAADAVTLGGSGVVAHFGLRHARFAPGESVLVRGAAGGIGVLTVQLAARAGAGAVAVTTSSAQRGERLRALGATHVLDRAGDGDGAPAGYDVIVDVVSGPGLPPFLSRLNPNGRVVAVGATAGPPPADFGLGLYAAFQQSLSFATFSSNTVAPEDRRAVTAELFASAVRGETQAVLDGVLPLADAATALGRLAAGDVFGRLALTP